MSFKSYKENCKKTTIKIYINKTQILETTDIESAILFLQQNKNIMKMYQKN